MTTLGGYQERIVLRDRCWIDVARVVDASLKNTPDYRPMRGLSRNPVCISVAIDVHKSMVAMACGHGKPSGKTIWGALESYVADGMTFLHDREHAHGPRIRAVRGASDVYKTDADPTTWRA